MRFTFLSFAIFFFLGSAEIMAQDIPADSVELSNTLYHQFQDMKDKSNRYQEYKVVKEVFLDTFWKSVQDSISEVKIDLTEAQAKIKEQNNKLDTLRQEIENQANMVEKSEYERAHITVMGVDMLKENYKFLNWGIIIGLILVLAIAIFKYNNSNKVAVDKRRQYESINNELNDYKQDVRERETKLRRELQTERNKVEELYQKIASLKKS